MRIVALLMAGLLVAACSSNSDKAGGASASAASAQQSAAITTPGNGVTATPGTQMHLQQVTSADRVFFGFDQYAITPVARMQIAEWADWMNDNPAATILVEGHCDERGTRDYNLALGARRSNAVKEALTSLGVASSRIETTTFGKERPAVLGSNEAAWAQNRRGVVVVQNGPSS
jgi:peptidoglycan-associated lipoprotein